MLPKSLAEGVLFPIRVQEVPDSNLSHH